MCKMAVERHLWRMEVGYIVMAGVICLCYVTFERKDLVVV